MAFLHPNYFPFCPRIGFAGTGLVNRPRYQGPFSLEQAMALFWKVASVSISGTQKGPEDFPYSFTWSGPSTMSGMLCPPWGWEELLPSPPQTVFDSPLIFSTLSGNPYDDRNVVFSGGSYYIIFDIFLGVDEGAPIISDSQNSDTIVSLQIDTISVPIAFRTIAGFAPLIYQSTIDSFTCTLRDPS